MTFDKGDDAAADAAHMRFFCRVGAGPSCGQLIESARGSVRAGTVGGSPPESPSQLSKTGRREVLCAGFLVAPRTPGSRLVPFADGLAFDEFGRPFIIVKVRVASANARKLDTTRRAISPPVASMKI